MEILRKVYVGVMARFDPDGSVTPLSIEWEDGTCFEIDKVLDVRRAASLKAGGSGMRYTIRIGRRESYIWYEDGGRWFVEARSA